MNRSGAFGALTGAVLVMVASVSYQATRPAVEHGDLEEAHQSCGVELWQKKLMRDPDIARVNMTPVATTVDALRALPVPKRPSNRRIAPEELQVYSVKVNLVEAATEADSDIHVVVADPLDGKTMIAEIPDAAACGQGTAPELVAKMNAARVAFVAKFGAPGPSTKGFTALSGTATITGPAFVDKLHGQTGVAPNGIEIHPVLDFVVH